MGMYEDVMAIEGEAQTELEYYSAIQRQINAGHWGLQGSHGRAMMEAIRGGQCLLGKRRAADYYGNVIPSRDDVEDGTKGSLGFVEKASGKDWAAKMAAL